MDATSFIIIGKVHAAPEIVQLTKFEMLKFVVVTETWYRGMSSLHYHEVIAFGDKKIDYIKDKVKAGARIKVTGTLRGKPFMIEKDGVEETRYNNTLKVDTVAMDSRTISNKPEPDPEETDDDDGLPF